MAFSSGTFSLYSPGNPVVTGTTISSTWANSTLSDIATGLSTCVLKDGTQTITANLPMATYKLTGLGAGSASGDSLRYEQVNGVVTTAGDILYASAAGTLARLALGAAGTRLHSTGSSPPEWQGTWFKVGSTTYNLATASGNQAITGVGFKPKAVLLLAGVAGNVYASWGFSDGSSHMSVYSAYAGVAGNFGPATTAAIALQLSGTDAQSASVTSLDADGFTLAWTKAGSPTGTATIMYLAFR